MAPMADSSTALPAIVLACDDVESRHEEPHLPTDTSARGVATPPTSRARVKLPAALGSSPLPTKPTKATGKPTTTLLPPVVTPNNHKAFHCKLNALQLSSLLKPFWNDLLQNQLKPVRRTLQDNHLRVVDFDSPLVRYAPNADGTPLHLCAQFGFLAMAKMLVTEFGLSATHRNKVGSTPLHVACKSGHTAVVSWLVDELHVPLDVPDSQNRTAFDVAPYDIVDKCVLAPLRDQYAALLHTEEELVGQNATAMEELLTAELEFRRCAMTLSDTEAHVDEARATIETLSIVERHWYEQLQSRNEALVAGDIEYDRLQSVLELEQANAQELFEKKVRSVHEENVTAQQELEALQTLVDTTQYELDRRTQLLQDQVGVFDAALVEFPGSKDVQQWALATLMAIASSVGGDGCDRELLLLRPEPVEVVRHVLTGFSSDYGLQYEAVELLVATQRIHTKTTTHVETLTLFVTAVVDSDLLLLLGECLGRWFEADQVKTATSDNQLLSEMVFEAIYWCLRLPRNAPRTLAFCQRKHLTCIPLQALLRCHRPSARLHISLVLLTQVQFGVKKPLLANGIMGIVFEWLNSTVAETDKDGDTDSHVAPMETAHNLFAAMALLTSLPSAQRCEGSKHVEPRFLEDLTPDAQSVTGRSVLKFVDYYSKHDNEAVGTVMWAFRLLRNLVGHGGMAARRIRQELLHEDGYSVVDDSLQRLLASSGDITQAVQATLDLVQAVWIERFDQEGQLLPTQTQVLASLANAVIAYVDKLLVHANNLLYVADALKALSRAAVNARNAGELTKRDSPIESSLVQPVLHFVIRHVDETRSSYRETQLVELLFHVLKLYFHVLQARLRANDVSDPRRELHNNSREIGVCTVLTAFKPDHHMQEPQTPADPTAWVALKALCVQIAAQILCSC